MCDYSSRCVCNIEGTALYGDVKALAFLALILTAIADHHIDTRTFLVDDEKVVFELKPNQHVLQPQAVDSRFEHVLWAVLIIRLTFFLMGAVSPNERVNERAVWFALFKLYCIAEVALRIDSKVYIDLPSAIWAIK